MTKEEKLEKHLSYILSSCIPTMIQEVSLQPRNARTCKLMHIFEAAENSEEVNDLSGNPSDWGIVRGIKAVVEATVTAMENHHRLEDAKQNMEKNANEWVNSDAFQAVVKKYDHLVGEQNDEGKDQSAG